MSRKKLTVSKTDYARIEELASRGLSIALIADSLGISKATLDRRISESDDFSRVMSRGRAKV